MRLLARLGPCDAEWAERLCDTVLHGLVVRPLEGMRDSL
jgi:hypothetical protein